MWSKERIMRGVAIQKTGEGKKMVVKEGGKRILLARRK